MGRVNGGRPYGEVIVGLNSDSSGNISIFDTTGVYQISASTIPGSSDLLLVGGSGSRIEFNAASGGSSFFTINNSVAQATLDATHLTFTAGPNTFDGSVGVSVNHIIGVGSPPGLAAGVGAGTSPTLSISGTDAGGNITITTGSTPASNSIILTVSFALSFGGVPRNITLTPGNKNSAQLVASGLPYVNQAATTVTSFTIMAVAALAASTQYQWFYSITK
jgi:hypothetical protein